MDSIYTDCKNLRFSKSNADNTIFDESFIKLNSNDLINNENRLEKLKNFNLKMKRNTNQPIGKENRRAVSSSQSIKAHTTETESSFDRVESIRFETHELQNIIQSLFSRMNEHLNYSNQVKPDQTSIKVDKKEFQWYYQTMKDTYKTIKKLESNWAEMITEKDNKIAAAVAKKEKEIASLKQQFKIKVQAMEAEKIALVSNLKSELENREQELFDSAQALTRSLGMMKKNWTESNDELSIILQEQKQTLNSLSLNKEDRIQALSDDIERIFSNSSPTKGPISSARGNLSSERARNNPLKSHFKKLGKFLSPIVSNEQGLDKSKEEPSTKRSKIPDTSYEELMFFDKMKSPNENGVSYQEQLVDDSRISMVKIKPQDGWDPDLDDDDSSENSECEKIEKALELLYRYGVLDQESLTLYENIMATSLVERESHMNLFRDHIRVQLKNYRKIEKNRDLPLNRKNTNDVNQTQDENKTIDESQISPELEQYSNFKKGDCEEESLPGINMKNGVHIPRLSKNLLLKKKEKKTDISLNDLLGAKECSILSLQSPLSSHRSRGPPTKQIDFRDVAKEEIEMADSLPVTIKTLPQGDLIKILQDKEFGEGIHELMMKKNSKFAEKNERPLLNQYKIKIEEELENSKSLQGSLNPNKTLSDSSDESMEVLNDTNKKLMYQDESQLISEPNIDSKAASLVQKENFKISPATDRVFETKKENFLSTPLSTKNLNENVQAPNSVDASNHGKKLAKRSISPGVGHPPEVRMSPGGMSQEIFRRNKLNGSNVMKKYNPKNTSFRNSYLINSNNMRNFSTNQSTFSAGVDNGQVLNLQFDTIGKSFSNTEPYFNLFEKNGFEIIESDDSTSPLNQSFPPFSKKQLFKEIKLNGQKKNAHYMSIKSVLTADTSTGLKVLHNGTNVSNNNSSIKDQKYITGHSRSGNNFYSRAKNIGVERLNGTNNNLTAH